MSPEQEKLFQRAVSENMITDDPVVNHQVDMQMSGTTFPYDQAMYEEEIAVWKMSGGMILTAETNEGL